MFTAFLLDAQHKKRDVGEGRPASSLVVSLGKVINGIASTLECLNWQLQMTASFHN